MDLDLVFNTIVSDAMLNDGTNPALLQARGGKVRGAKVQQKRQRQWLPEEDAFLRDNLGFLPEKEIAERLGRSEQALHVRRVRMGYPPATRPDGWLTANRVASLMGLDSHVVPGWVRQGILPGRAAANKERLITLINFEQLKFWLTRPQHWPYFKVDKMKPGYLRRLVEKAQARWGDEWLTTRQATDLLGLEHPKQLLADIVMNRSLPAIHCRHIGARNNATWSYWFIRKSDVMKHVHPRGTDTRTKWCTPRAEAFMWKMHLQGKNAFEIGRMMKRDGKAVGYHIRRIERKNGAQ